MAYPHVTKANRYARQMVAGKITAPHTIRLAWKRHLDDLKASVRRNHRYTLDKDLAEDACEFIELLPHTKGEWARRKELIKLQPCQCFLIVSIFGWVHKQTFLRRFREVYFQVARKNAKSMLAAAIGLFMLAVGGEAGAEVYSGATTETQALEIFKPAKLMIQKTPALVSHYGVEAFASNISIADDGGKFEPIIGNPGDGSSPSCALIGEYHEHKNSDRYDTMITGMGARQEPLAVITTTAGKLFALPCYGKYQEGKQVLEGTMQNGELLVVIYEVDEDVDWKSAKALTQANPMMGISVNADFLRQQQFIAAQNANRVNTFKN
jgi:phage terminase large subunit-like protein